MGREGPETKLIKKMRAAGTEKYGDRLVQVKNHGDAYTEAGLSDLTCTLDGVSIACEVKSPESSKHKRATIEASVAHALEHGPTVKQRLFVARVLKAGGCAGFAATVEQYMEQLEHAAYMASYDAMQRDDNECDGHNV